MFTESELELLIEGLDAIMSHKAASFLNDALFGAILASSREEAEDNMDKSLRKMSEDKESQKVMQNRITLLKAKLIQLSDELAVSNAVKEMKQDV